MNVRSGRRTRHLNSKSDERYAHAAQVGHQRSPFHTVRMNGNVHRVSVIKSHALMDRSLTHSADRQLMAETFGEKFLDLASIGKRPSRAPVVTDERCGLAVAA